jgi:Squalene-hopene cyclase N-terminal domain
LDTQLPDGSWEQVHEHNLQTGGLDPTIFNYWYLKSVGVDHESAHMVSARKWIREKGGIEGAQTMTKFKLAVFGQYSWGNLAKVPLMLFYKNGFFASQMYIKDIVAQWVYPHLTALSYLRHHQTVFKVGADIRELYLTEPPYIAIDEVPSGIDPHPDVQNLVNEMLGLRQRLGSFGGYTISTLLSMLALRDFQDRYPHLMVETLSTSIA